MRTYVNGIARAALAVAALWGCRETPTEPPATPSLRRAAVGTYTAVDLGTLGGTFSYPSAINPAGQVVGASETANGEMHAFLWQHGVMIDLLGEQYSYSWANDINPAGQVVGRTDRGAFLWQNGVTRYLPMYDAVAINAGGAVVGYGALGARVWKNGVVTEIGPIGENSCGGVSDINPRGQVVGSHLVLDFGDEFWCHGFLWQNGQLTDLGTLGGDRSAAMAINPAGQVVGYSEGGLVSPEAFLWQNGVMKGLGTLGGGESYAYAITPGGEVLGESSSVRGEFHAFLWKNGVMTDLDFSGGTFALHISSKGQIVGTSWGAQCCEHATLWTRK